MANLQLGRRNPRLQYEGQMYAEENFMDMATPRSISILV